eukprot:scaffold167438_cov25-Tisochrysis_lutea.AAC.2
MEGQPDPALAPGPSRCMPRIDGMCHAYVDGATCDGHEDNVPRRVRRRARVREERDGECRAALWDVKPADCHAAALVVPDPSGSGGGRGSAAGAAVLACEPMTARAVGHALPPVVRPAGGAEHLRHRTPSDFFLCFSCGRR